MRERQVAFEGTAEGPVQGLRTAVPQTAAVYRDMTDRDSCTALAYAVQSNPFATTPLTNEQEAVWRQLRAETRDVCRARAARVAVCPQTSDASLGALLLESWGCATPPA